MEIRAHVSLKPYNTFGIEASARYFTAFGSVEECRQVLSDKAYRDVPLLVLGGGSNLLFTRDFDGLVLRNALRGITLLREDENYYYLKAGAGENWHELVRYCVAHNYAGLENLSLIPGCVGASPMQNIGAYGVEMKDCFETLEALHIPTLEVHDFSSEACRFGYRESVFKREYKGQYIILSVTFKLRKQPVFHTSYGAIEQELEAMGVKELSIQAISEAVINIRRSKLPDPRETGNAGSFFKNPEVSQEQYHQLLEQHPGIVAYPLPGGTYKLAAGWLIEKAGWKGRTYGNYGVHARQALVLVNYGGASGRQIYDLSEEILQSIQAQFGVQLEREVNVW